MTTQLDFARASFAADLASYGGRPAILTENLALTYRELADRVDALALRLGAGRRLVALTAANDVDSLVAYLAALTSGHPLILLPEDKPAALESLVAAYDPTTLPMSYCYGLSVINSHLLRGAGLVLTDLSVVDPCFWDLFRSQEATAFAAVPYTFELLERVGFADMELPGLRYVTQAGGRLAPDKVRSYAELGRRNGWDLFVMYGQTEATARMAYLPPELASTIPGAIGIPVPGGSFRIDPVPGLEDGELVYTGPNVMLGYADSPDDLAAGRTIHELRTGDVARQHPTGVYEVVGRRSRFVKIVGLRVDLGQLERLLADLGLQGASAGTDQGLVVAIEGEHDTQLLGKVLAQGIGLPRVALEVHAVEHLPRLATGKLDYPAVLALSRPQRAEPVPGDDAATDPDNVRKIFEDTLERAHRGQRHLRPARRGFPVLCGGIRQARADTGASPAGLARDACPRSGTVPRG
ncbi:AMP-binding protein [Pseudarthrobacter sp. N5]|uniref:AMP-binding protein n=1 Tax=Pseudarthrobacter sp. N5 TaxID=3418416 RepID=UPI003CF06422